MHNLSINMRAIAFVLFGFLAFNIADAFLKYITSFYSLGIVGFFPILSYLFFMVIFSKKLGNIKSIYTTKRKPILIVRSLFGTGCFVSFLYAIHHLTLAQVYTLLLLSPIWVALISIVLFKEKISWHRWSAIIFGFIGIFVVLRPGIVEIEFASLVALFGGICFACLVLTSRKIGDKEPLINLVFYPILTDMIAMAAIITFNDAWVIPELSHFPLFFTAGVFFLIGTLYTSKGYTTGDSSLLAPLHYSQILWGALIGYFVFAEKPEIWTLTGAMIIVLSGIYLIHREHKTEQSK